MNILLQEFDTPFGTVPFHKINTKDYLPAIEVAIKTGKEEIGKITSLTSEPTFENTLEALERSGDLVGRISSIFFNLNSAETTPEIQKIAKSISPLLTAFSNDIILDKKLFERVRHVYDHRQEITLTAEQEMLLQKTYKSFVRNGANLDSVAKSQLREIDSALAQLSLEFGEHVLSETNSYKLEITQEQDLAGLPESVKEAAVLTAREKGLPNSWLFTLQAPSYLAFMTYAENRSLREELYRAFASRAFKPNENNNENVLLKIVKLRYERARLLGFASHADFVLQERMAESAEKVENFLVDLLQHAKPIALQELKEIL